MFGSVWFMHVCGLYCCDYWVLKAIQNRKTKHLTLASPAPLFALYVVVENRLEQMRVEIRLSTQKLNQVYRMGLMLMPKDIRAMPLATFREVYQGDMIKVMRKTHTTIYPTKLAFS